LLAYSLPSLPAGEEIVSPDIFSRRIRLQLPDRLPRAMAPEDLQKFLSVIRDTRDRAMIIVLLRRECE